MPRNEALFAIISAQASETESVTLAAGLPKADRGGEGDPRIVGTRSSGRLGMRDRPNSELVATSQYRPVGSPRHSAISVPI